MDGGSKLSMSSSSTASNPFRAHMPMRSPSMGFSASSWRRSTQRSSGKPKYTFPSAAAGK